MRNLFNKKNYLNRAKSICGILDSAFLATNSHITDPALNKPLFFSSPTSSMTDPRYSSNKFVDVPSYESEEDSAQEDHQEQENQEETDEFFPLFDDDELSVLDLNNASSADDLKAELLQDEEEFGLALADSMMNIFDDDTSHKNFANSSGEPQAPLQCLPSSSSNTPTLSTSSEDKQRLSLLPPSIAMLNSRCALLSSAKNAPNKKLADIAASKTSSFNSTLSLKYLTLASACTNSINGNLANWSFKEDQTSAAAASAPAPAVAPQALKGTGRTSLENQDEPFSLKRQFSIMNSCSVAMMLGDLTSPILNLKATTEGSDQEHDQGEHQLRRSKRLKKSESKSSPEDDTPATSKDKHQEKEVSKELHQACCDKNVSVKDIRIILGKLIGETGMTGAGAAAALVSRPMILHSVKQVYSHQLRTHIHKVVKEKYTYPLNLAIQHGANPKVIEFLIDTAPCVLTRKDGQMEESSLSILLKYSNPHDPSTMALVDKILYDAPECASLKDRHSNAPLHIACSYNQTSLDVVQHIWAICPEALRCRNFHGLNPHELAQKHTLTCSDEVSKFFLSIML